MQQFKSRVLAGFFLFFALTTALPAIAATPQISSVAGNMTNGDTVTVYGSNLVDENTTNWILFFQNNPNASSFEGASPAADGYSQMGPTGGTYVANMKLLGNQSINFPVSLASTGPGPNQLTNYNAIETGGPDGQDLWFRFYVAWDSPCNLWPTNHIKMIDDIAGSTGDQWYFQPAATTGLSLPSSMVGGWDSASHSAGIPSGKLQNNRWYCMEMHWKTTPPYSFQAWVDGAQIFNASPTNPSSLAGIEFGVINAWSTPWKFSLNHWWDGFAISTSRVYPASTIQVGNSPTYGWGNEQYQQPIALNDNDVQFVLNTRAVGSGPYYLWITNNSQVLNAPYEFHTSGSSGGPTSPSAPGGGGSGCGEGCLIATVAFGSYLSPQVQTLREFRDSRLLTNRPGAVLVAFYHRWSPPVANCIRKHPVLRAAARYALTPVVCGAE